MRCEAERSGAMRLKSGGNRAEGDDGVSGVQLKDVAGWTELVTKSNCAKARVVRQEEVRHAKCAKRRAMLRSMLQTASLGPHACTGY